MEKTVCVKCGKPDDGTLYNGVCRQCILELRKDCTVDKYNGQYRLKYSLGFFTAWIISIVSFIIPLVILRFAFGIEIQVDSVASFAYWKGILDSVLEQSVHSLRMYLSGAGLLLTFIFIFATLYNVIDLLATPFWIGKSSKKRRQVRGEVIGYIARLPINVIWWCIKFPFVFLMAVFGIPVSDRGEFSQWAAEYMKDRYGSTSTGASATPSEQTVDKKEVHIRDRDGNVYKTGGVFRDWKGNLVEWGNPFYDSKGNLVGPGSPFYDNRGNYCTWDGPFYDAGDNYVDPR